VKHIDQMKNSENDFISDVKQILEKARQKAYSATAFAMIEGYWLMGKHIVEHEQQGKTRAEYGTELLNNLSVALGKGFSSRMLRDFVNFTLRSQMKKIWHTRVPN